MPELNLLFELGKVALVDLELAHFSDLQNPGSGHDGLTVAG